MGEHLRHTAPSALDNRSYAAVRLAGASTAAPSVEIACGDAVGRISIAAIWPCRPVLSGSIAVHASFGGEPGTIYLPAPLHGDCVAGLFDGKLRSELPTEAAALVFETATAHLLDSLERLISTSIAITGVAPANDADPDAITTAIDFEPQDGPRTRFYAALPRAIARRLTDLARRDGENGAAASTSTMLAVRAGSSQITQDELRAIEPGDVIVLDRTPLVAGRLMLVVAEAVCAFIGLSDEEPRLVTAFDSIRSTTFAPHLQVNGMWFARGDTPLLVHADLARFHLTIDVIEAFEIGQPFALPHDIDGPIELFVGDLRIADGVLVRGDGWLGVKLTRVYADE